MPDIHRNAFRIARICCLGLVSMESIMGVNGAHIEAVSRRI